MTADGSSQSNNEAFVTEMLLTWLCQSPGSAPATPIYLTHAQNANYSWHVASSIFNRSYSTNSGCKVLNIYRVGRAKIYHTGYEAISSSVSNMVGIHILSCLKQSRNHIHKFTALTDSNITRYVFAIINFTNNVHFLKFNNWEWKLSTVSYFIVRFQKYDYVGLGTRI